MSDNERSMRLFATDDVDVDDREVVVDVNVNFDVDVIVVDFSNVD